MLAAQNCILEGFGRAQSHDGLGLDLDGLAGLGVATHARLAVRLNRASRDSGITNLPALPLHSFTASLKSSSKNVATVFLGVPLLSARWATIFDLLIGFAIVFFFSSSKVSSGSAVSPDCGQCTRDTIKTPDVQGKRKQSKNTIKMRVPEIAVQNHQYSCGFCGWVKRAAQILGQRLAAPAGAAIARFLTGPSRARTIISGLQVEPAPVAFWAFHSCI